MTGYLHVLFSPRAEGCPRLALDLLAQEERQLGRKGHVAFLVGQPDDLAAEFAAAAASRHLLGWRRRGFAALFVRALRLLRKLRPEGVVCYTVGHHVSVCAAAWLLGIPSVLHLGNPPPLDKPDTIRKIGLMLRLADRFTTAYAACSSPVRERSLEAYGLDPAKVALVRNGIDLDRFLAVRDRRVARPTRTGPLRIGMVASLEPSKEHPTLLRALARRRAEGEDVELVLIGDGSRRAELEALAGRLDIARAVIWRGSVRDVPGELGKLDVFAFSANPAEGLGIALIEALVSGLPVVASDVPACRAVLEDGRWGLLAVPGDAEDWARTLARYREARIPGPDALAIYDVGQTFRSYRALLA
ncbi:MAG: glycosyltransferase [Proteobacteria bacterium]|nr:glycosyltransferase [Pseudomonadota bacterium]